MGGVIRKIVSPKPPAMPAIPEPKPLPEPPKGFNSSFVGVESKSFVLSDSFKTQLDARGYDDYNKGLMSGNVGGNDNRENDKIVTQNNNNATQINNNTTKMASGVVTNTGTVTAPSNAEVAQAQSTTMSSDEILLANKKKGRKDTILTSASGLGESNILNTKKKTLGA